MREEVPSGADNELERSIKAAMMRMKKVAADSDDEDRGDDSQSADWDSWEHKPADEAALTQTRPPNPLLHGCEPKLVLWPDLTKNTLLLLLLLTRTGLRLLRLKRFSLLELSHTNPIGPPKAAPRCKRSKKAPIQLSSKWQNRDLIFSEAFFFFFF